MPFTMTQNAFFGRTGELDHVVGLLAGSRLVTLTGPAGVGKTRLAVEVVARVGSSRGALLVELAPMNDETAVVEALASMLSARQVSGRPPLEAVMARLAERPALLVLDNCEHIVDVCGRVVDDLLRGVPTVRLLVTSREPLALPSEIVVEVHPLASSDAAALFTDRVASRGVTIGPAAGPAAAEICRRLDGLPLAIELAAARVGFLTPQEIAARLDDRFHLLKAAGRCAPAHHESLLTALEWSHDLLSPDEAALFRRLAVFTGGWTLDAAETVCAAPGAERSGVLEVLGRLAAQSLVVCTQTGPTTRYRYLDTVRSFAQAKLSASDEETAMGAAHAAWYGELAVRAEPALSGRDQGAWLERLEAERANLRAALEWSLGSSGEDALRIAGSLSLFWLVRGRLGEGREWLKRSLALGVGAPVRLRTRAQWGAGALASALGEFEEARAYGTEALTQARASGDPAGAARALYLLGFVNAFRDLPAARSLLEQSIEAAEETGDHWCLVSALGVLGFAEVFRGDFTAAMPCFERSLVTSRESGDQQGLRMALLGLGYVALLRGAYGTAAVALEEGLGVARRLGDPFWTAVALAYLGELARSRGEGEAARRYCEEGVALAAGTGSPLLLGFCLSFAGRAALSGGAMVEARARFEEALALPRLAGNLGNSAIALLGLAEVTMAMADEVRARLLFDEALAMARQSGDRLVLAAALLGSAREVRGRGDGAAAERMAHAALDHSAEMGHPPGLAAALEAIAGLATEEGRLEYAARLFGAAARLRRDVGCPPAASELAACDLDLAQLRKDLSSETLEAAWNQGAGLSPEEACGYVRRGRGPRGRPASGWASLTPAEQEVTRLAVRGLTNVEIGDRLFISRRTVQTHLSHVFAKLGVASRRELARAAELNPGP